MENKHEKNNKKTVKLRNETKKDSDKQKWKRGKTIQKKIEKQNKDEAEKLTWKQIEQNPESIIKETEKAERRK